MCGSRDRRSSGRPAESFPVASDGSFCIAAGKSSAPAICWTPQTAASSQEA